MAGIATITACLVVIGLAGCRRRGGEPDRHYNAEAGFSLRLPAGWEVYLADAGTTGATFKPDGDIRAGLLVNVFYPNRGLEDADLDDCFNYLISEDTELYTETTEIERGDTKIGRLKAKWIVTTARFQDERFKSLAYVLTSGRKCVTIVFSCEPESFDAHRAMFESIAGSFRVKGD